MIRKLLCFLLFCLAFAGKGTAQSIDSALFKWVDQLPIEKIYVQFDNRHYSPGQTIWFKSYLLLNQLPSTQSKNFYIDWYNSSGKLVGNTVVPIFKGSASGSFVVPKKMEGESINAIAYTQWMKNFDSAFYFKRQFTISNEHTKTAKKEFPETTVQFLPESGNTIIGVNCNMAFKAVNQSGLPENIKGVVKNKTGAIVSTFKSIHNGMGTFKYKPEVGEMYTAEWTDILGNLHETGLPVADKMGVSVIMEAGSLDRYFEISRSIDVPEAWKKLTVLAQSNGEILFKAIVNLSTKTSIKIKLPVFQFPSGITQLTIFDIDNKPLCERQFFVNNLEYSLKANVNADTLNVEKRGKNVFVISVDDTTITNLSVAITDGNINGIADNNIVSQLLLTSDLKGYVYQPAYYFSSDEDSISKQLDLVMLTNGWRKYNWNQVLNEKVPKLSFQRDTVYLSLRGKIKDLSAAKIKKAEFVEMILVSKDSTKSMLLLPIEQDGSFNQNNLILFDTTQIFYKLKGVTNFDNKNLSIWNNIFQPDSNRIISTTHFNIDTAGNGLQKFIVAESNRIEQLKMQTTLKEVVVKSISKSPIRELDEKYTNGLFTGTNAIQFDLTNDFVGGMGNALTYLQGKVPGLTITSPSFAQNARISWRGFDVLLFLNEFKIDQQQLLSITMSDVAYIKVFRPPFMGTFASGGSGAIAVYTKKGVDVSRSTKGLEYILWPGYSPRKEFYSPNYAEQQAEHNKTDMRHTLYWHPMISTNKENQQINISFYNNDFSKSMHVILEGMDNEGRLVHFSKLIQ